MKIWGIIVSVLLVVAIGLGGWLYKQNRDLKNQKNQLQTELSTANTAKDQADTKITAAGEKFQLLNMFLNNNVNASSQLQISALVNKINDATLTSDYQALLNSKQGDNSAGNKMMQDIITSINSDLGVK